jgi:hypothetical protein
MPLVTNGRLTHRYDERVHDGMRLGRHLELDPRSLAFLPDPELARKPIKPAEWVPPIPTLNQGQLGSCTGNAGTYHMAALAGPGRANTLALKGNVLSATDAAACESFAVELYHEATVLDGFPGDYPPDDTGSSGLGVCRALKANHLIGRYVWATNLRAFGVLLQRAGVIIGTPWFESWFRPGPDGFVDDNPDWANSGVAGGHEVYVEALEAWDEQDPAKSVIRFHNSWGDGWGDHGCGRMRLSTYKQLQASVDVKQAALPTS